MPVTYLPSVMGGTSVAAQGYLCGMNEKAYQFSVAWLAILGERASVMVCDSRLVRASQEHAEYLQSRAGAELEQNMHIGRNGSLSNDRVKDAGYRLPSYYERGKNNVESCSRHYGEPRDVLDAFLASPSHRSHLLREDWFSLHCAYGIGSAAGHWVCISAPVES